MTKQQPENPQPLALNSKAKAARKLGVSFNTVQRWIRNGKLETVQIGDRTWVPEAALMKLHRPEGDQP